MTMTPEEAKELIEKTYPDTVDGAVRPTEHIAVDMPYNEDMPQLFSGDYVAPDQLNLNTRQLLSNDKSIVDGTTPVAKATTADNCTGNSATATKLQTARTVSLTGAVTGSGTFDGSGDIRIVTTESPVAYNRNALWSVSSRCNLVSPSWYKVGVNGTCYMVSSSSTLNLNTASSWDNSTYATAANRAGKDFYIYACDTGSSLKIVLSANSTVPTGYTSGTSRKVGGFHCLCLSVGTISGHTLSGYVTGDILPASVWDLLHRPVSEPEGMVWSGREWVDIYLASWNGSRLVSVYGGTIADGYSSTPFHGELFVEKFGLVNKRLPLRDQFVAFAKGSNEMTNIKGSGDPGTTGGHYDTAGRRMISNIGCEDCCGALWQWTADITGLGNQYQLDTTNKIITNLPGTTAQTSSAEGDHWIYDCTWQSDGRSTANIGVDGATNKYGLSYGIFTRALAGGNWVNGSRCGSRSANLSDLSSSRAAYCAGRGASEPRAVSL